MQVERQFVEVKQRQVVIELPESFINHRVEIIALTIDEEDAKVAKPRKRRRPHADITGTAKMVDDLTRPVVNQADWECLR